ncbi:MAG: DUF5116 domain-containing protein, partial [Alistipes sp.]
LAAMSELEGDGLAAEFERRGKMLRAAIRKNLYDANGNKLNYLLDHRGVVHPYHEALGVAFAGLSGVVSPSEMSRIVRGAYTSDFGIPCVYPSFPRFSTAQPGRHNAIIWPFVNAFYADAALQAGERDVFGSELRNMASLAIKYGPDNFQEVYNMTTGAPDGGWQRGEKWWLNPHQTWSATGYLRLFLLDVFGINFSTEGIALHPVGLSGCEQLELKEIARRC